MHAIVNLYKPLFIQIVRGFPLTCSIVCFQTGRTSCAHPTRMFVSQ